MVIQQEENQDKRQDQTIVKVSHNIRNLKGLGKLSAKELAIFFAMIGEAQSKYLVTMVDSNGKPILNKYGKPKKVVKMPIDNSVTLSIQRLRHLASLGNESNKQIVDRYFSNQPEPLTINEQMELLQTGINLHSIYMVDENENEIITAPAIARWVINKHTLEVIARINPEYLEWFSEVVNQYILFNLRDFVKLKSKYSMILFLELSTFWNTGMYYKRINDLREILGVNPTRNNRDFINNVLKPAIAALKEYFPELSLTVEKNSSDSRKITHVRLKFDKLTITDMQERLRSSEGASLVEYQQELENMEGEEKAVNDPTPEIDLSNVEW